MGPTTDTAGFSGDGWYRGLHRLLQLGVGSPVSSGATMSARPSPVVSKAMALATPSPGARSEGVPLKPEVSSHIGAQVKEARETAKGAAQSREQSRQRESPPVVSTAKQATAPGGGAMLACG